MAGWRCCLYNRLSLRYSCLIYDLSFWWDPSCGWSPLIMNLQNTETNLSFLLATIDMEWYYPHSNLYGFPLWKVMQPLHIKDLPPQPLSWPGLARAVQVVTNVELWSCKMQGGTATRKQEISKASFVASSAQPLFKTGPRPSMNICFLLDWWSVLMNKLCVSLLRINCLFRSGW